MRRIVSVLAVTSGIGVFALGAVASSYGPSDFSTSLLSTGLVSLNPYGAFLEGGAFLLRSGFDAPIRLPGAGEKPDFAFGFTLPFDYKSNTPVFADLLWEAPDSDCDFVLKSNFLYRARTGKDLDAGEPAGGFDPIWASTDFSLDPVARSITMAAPEDAHETARARFRIIPTEGEFPTLRPGDTMTFGVFRDDTLAEDSCPGDLGIAGVAILYEKVPQASQAGPEPAKTKKRPHRRQS